jgi:protein-disulfide isomerase
MPQVKKLPLGKNPAQTILVVLLVVAAFVIGTLYTKLQYAQSGTAPAAGQAAAKYKTFDDAMKAMAKIAKVDGNKLVSCMNSGDKKSIVDADAAEGEKLGVDGTPSFYINGRKLGGAFPFESFKEIIDKELAGEGSNNLEDYSQTLQDAHDQQGAFDPVPKQIALGNAPTQGPAGAPVTIVEYSDFQCPFCSRAEPTVKQILQTYGDKVLFAYKHFPLISIHPHAQKTAEASECARDQGKFWEFHNALFDNQTDWENL